MASTVGGQGVTRSLVAVVADDRAFQVWYDAALPEVYAYLFHRSGRDPEIAQELTQQTFVDAIRSKANAPDGAPVAWLIGIARHRLADHFRGLERHERGLLRLVSRTSEPTVAWVGAGDAGTDLVTALRQLPAAQRAALILRYQDDLPVREVARLLDRSEGAVESLLSRGRETLRRLLGDVA
jgi:RNA polymerase sigma-70 factor (ECF subfamily)